MRIQGITLPDKKRMEIALTAIFGVGRPLAHKILDEAKVEYGKKPTDLTADEENAVRLAVEKYQIEGEHKRSISSNV